MSLRFYSPGMLLLATNGLLLATNGRTGQTLPLAASLHTLYRRRRGYYGCEYNHFDNYDPPAI